MCFSPQLRALFGHRMAIASSKSGTGMWCFEHFHFQICFAPQRRALFAHLKFQKWSERGVFCTLSLPNVLRATTACTFSTSQLPKVLRQWGALYISLPNLLRATTACNFSCLICLDVSAPAALASLLCDTPEPQNTGKTQCFATFLPFRAPASSHFWLSPSLLFSLQTCFSICPYCRKLSF